MQQDRHDQAAADIRAAIEMRQHPGDTELAALTDRLLTHCTTLANGLAAVPVDERPMRGVSAAEFWDMLRDSGPSDGALANFSYARQLALVARDMQAAVDQSRQFVGRTGLPPLAPGTPR